MDWTLNYEIPKRLMFNKFSSLVSAKCTSVYQYTGELSNLLQSGLPFLVLDLFSDRTQLRHQADQTIVP